MPISQPWIQYLGGKDYLFGSQDPGKQGEGLMPLQALVYQYYKDDKIGEKVRDPLFTYWLFLAYEDQVLRVMQDIKDAVEKKRDAVEQKRKTRDDAQTTFDRLQPTKDRTDSDSSISEIPSPGKVVRLEPTDEGALATLQTKLKNAQEELQKAQEELDDAEKDLPENLKQAYLKMSAYLHSDDDVKAKETLYYKTFLHMIGLGMVSLLMIGISATNASSLLSFLGSDGIDIHFDSYEGVVKCILYASSMWAQWMMFRKNVPNMMKMVCHFTAKDKELDWDFWETRTSIFELKDGKYTLGFKAITLEVTESLNAKLVRNKKNKNIEDAIVGDEKNPITIEIKLDQLPHYHKRKTTLLGLTACTALLAVSFGMLVFEKAGRLLSKDDGLFDLAEGDAIALGALFGVAAASCNFFLWTSGLYKKQKDEENKEKIAYIKAYLENLQKDKNSQEFKKSENLLTQAEWDSLNNKEAAPTKSSWVLDIMLAMAAMGLAASVTTQIKNSIGLTVAWDEQGKFGLPKVTYDPLNADAGWEGWLIVVGFAALVGAAMAGRYVFNDRATRNLYDLVGGVRKACTKENVKEEVCRHKANYILGTTLFVGVLAVFIASQLDESLQDPVWDDQSLFTPTGIALLSAVAIWGVCLTQPAFKNRDPEGQNLLHLKRDSERRSGQKVLAACINAMSYGAIGGAGMEYLVTSVARLCHLGDMTGEVGSVVLMVLSFGAQIALAATSLATSTNPVQIDNKNPTRMSMSTHAGI